MRIAAPKLGFVMEEESLTDYLARMAAESSTPPPPVGRPEMMPPPPADDLLEDESGWLGILGGLLFAVCLGAFAYFYVYLPEEENKQIRSEIQNELDSIISDYEKSRADLNDQMIESCVSGSRAACALVGD